jgi:hypothetical protein
MLPNVYLFNPTCEYAIANGTVSWQPNRLLQKMEADLGVLPLFFSKPGDFIMVKELPSQDYIDSLKQIGIPQPEFITFKKALSDKKFLAIPKGKLLPWGWSPAAHHLLSPLKESCSVEFKNSPNFQWQSQNKSLYSKQKASEISRIIINQINSEYLMPSNLVSQTCFSFLEVGTLNNLWGTLMVKAPWSTSGRGLQQVTQSPIHQSVKNRINGLIKEQGFVMVEPLLNKFFDMSFQFKSENGKISFVGMSYFQTDSKGQYQGNCLNEEQDKLGNPLSEIISFSKTTILPTLIKVLEEKGHATYYNGYFGVDTLIYNNKNGQLRINPCLEINLRYNMGLLSLNLEKYLMPSKKGMYKMFYNKGQFFGEFSEIMREKHPLQITNNRIDSGFLALTDSFKETKFGAYILIG